MEEVELLTQDIYSLDELRQAWKKKKHFSFTFFCNCLSEDAIQDEYNETCLSQWFLCDFVDENNAKYCCCEQYMMAKKAILFEDNDSLEKILNSKDPNTIMSLGRNVKNFDEIKWKENCREIVFQGNLYKFSQNEKCQEYITSVPLDTIFVDANPSDGIWGIKLASSNPRSKNPMNWQGTNWLGFELTRVRDYLASHQPELFNHD